MNIHPTLTLTRPSHASLLFDASFDSIESQTTSFAASVVPTLETTTVTEVALGYHRNGQYSITAMTTSTGAVAERYAYTAYGQPRILNASGTVLTSSAVGNRYTYTGREWDETLGIYHFRARWMNPLAGRFLGRDPIGFEGSGWGLYEVFNSQSFVNTDPQERIAAPPFVTLTPGLYNGRICSSYSVGGKLCTQDNFDDWHRKELSDLPTWLHKLKPCPCNIRCYGPHYTCNCRKEITSYTNTKTFCAPPGSGFSMTGFWGKSYHPSGEFELRQDPCGQPGNQCINDINGDVLDESQVDAGTTDKSIPCTLFGSTHFHDDVRPYDCAKCLGGQNPNKCFQVRPKKWRQAVF